MPNYNKSYSIYCILSATSLVIFKNIQIREKAASKRSFTFISHIQYLSCSLLLFIIQVLELVFTVSMYASMYAYYFTEGDSSYLLDGLNRFTYYRYYMGSLNKGVSITIVTIIPLATSFRIAAFIWFGFRKSKISLYTVTYIL